MQKFFIKTAAKADELQEKQDFFVKKLTMYLGNDDYLKPNKCSYKTVPSFVNALLKFQKNE